MHRELSTAAMQADGHWREHPDSGLIDTFRTRKMDVHLCREYPQIRRFTEPASHNAKALFDGVAPGNTWGVDRVC